MVDVHPPPGTAVAQREVPVAGEHVTGLEDAAPLVRGKGVRVQHVFRPWRTGHDAPQSFTVARRVGGFASASTVIRASFAFKLRLSGALDRWVAASAMLSREEEILYLRYQLDSAMSKVDKAHANEARYNRHIDSLSEKQRQSEKVAASARTTQGARLDARGGGGAEVAGRGGEGRRAPRRRTRYGPLR